MSDFKGRFKQAFEVVRPSFNEAFSPTSEFTEKHRKLASDIYMMCNEADPQTEETLIELMFLYADMFNNQCGSVPKFIIIDEKGRVELEEA